MKERLWKFSDESFESFDEYENQLPKTILEEYGHRLEEDTNNMLTFSIIEQQSTIDNTVKTHNIFYCEIPNRNYNVKFFEVFSGPLVLYPCKFHNLLTENRYDCSDKYALIEVIEKEIKHINTKMALNRLIYRFHKPDTIRNAEKKLSGE